jgi:hypothetical protein
MARFGLGRSQNPTTPVGGKEPVHTAAPPAQPPVARA